MRLGIACILAAMSTSALVAQAPPVKMGLWEKTTSITGGPTGSMTLKSKSCLTPDYWQEMVGAASKQQPNCTTNFSKTSNGYSFTSNCTLPHSTIVSKGTSTIQDSEHIVAESHSTTTRDGKAREMEIHSTSHFLSASCGDVKPGSPEIER